MSEYQAIRQGMEEELHRLRSLRDSQPAESDGFEHFQSKAQKVANDLMLLENNEATLLKLDKAVVQSERESDRAERKRSDRTGKWKVATVATGLAGMAIVAVSALLGLSFGPVLVGLLVLAAAGASGYQWFRVEDETLAVVRRQARELQNAEAEREEFAGQVLPAPVR